MVIFAHNLAVADAHGLKQMKLGVGLLQDARLRLNLFKLLTGIRVPYDATPDAKLTAMRARCAPGRPDGDVETGESVGPNKTQCTGINAARAIL